jgi:hypothetical protein
MRSARLVRRHSRSLDYGAGKGLLVRLLLDQRFDAWGYDPLSTPIAAEDRVRREVPPGPFRLITAIEVIEHLSDPVETLQRLCSLLAPRGLLVLSTELFDQRTHGASWHYLAQECGQHITLFSRQGLQEAATRASLRWVTSLRFDGIDFLHLLVPRDRRLSSVRWKVWVLRLRHYCGEAQPARRGRA